MSGMAGSRRSGRAVWGQQINTSFAVMTESELNSLASNSLTPTVPSEPHITHESFKEDAITPPKSQSKNLNCIQFPSPCVNKDSYQVKQVSIEQRQLKVGGPSQRPSWICSNNEDDFLFNMNREGDSSSEDIDTPSSNVNSPDKEEDGEGAVEESEGNQSWACEEPSDKNGDLVNRKVRDG